MVIAGNGKTTLQEMRKKMGIERLNAGHSNVTTADGGFADLHFGKGGYLILKVFDPDTDQTTFLQFDNAEQVNQLIEDLIDCRAVMRSN